MSDIRMVLGEDLLDVPIMIVGSKRPPPPDATGDFMAGTVCVLREPSNVVDGLQWVEIPFAEGEVARLTLFPDQLLPG